MGRRIRIVILLLAAALLTAALPGALAAPADGPAVHYTWNTVKSTGTDNLAALPCNVFYDSEAVRTKALALKRGTFYEAGGPRSFVSYSMYNGLGSQTDPDTGEVLRYGLPYRVIPRVHDFTAQDENLWFDLAKMPMLDTAGAGAVNLSMDYMWPTSGVTSDVAFARGMQVYVSLDGETFLPGWAGVRSVTLLGGGKIGSSTAGLLYRIETEDLLSIPGAEPGDVIRRIRIMPNGTDCRTYGEYITSTISVNVWAAREAFEAAVPRDEPEMIDLGEQTMRAIPLAEAARTANIAWTSPQDVVTVFPAGSATWASGLSTKTYEAGKRFRGPVYERDLGSTRELFASSIVNGVYGYNGAGFAPDESGRNTAYGMSCAIFLYNALSRVSRCGVWSVTHTLGDPCTRLLGDLVTTPRPAYTDADITEKNTAQQMYEHYALAQPGDIAVHFLTNEANSLHVRLVKSVSVVRISGGAIDGEASVMHCTEQTSPIASFNGGSYYSSTRADSTYTFAALLSSGYAVYTLTDYADGRVERENVQAVCAPLVKDGRYTDGVHLAISSNYRIIKYTVALQDVTNAVDLFTETTWCKSHNAMGANYESEALNVLLGSLPPGDYRIRLAVESGPLTDTAQTDVPVTVRDFDFTADCAPCAGTHDTRTALTAEYLESLPVTASGGNGPYCVLPAGSYYLDEDIRLSRTVRVASGSAVTLCLNGHTLEGTLAASADAGRYNGNAFLYVFGWLTLCDHTDGGAVRVNAGGEITDPAYSAYAVRVNGGTMNLCSGGIRASRGRYGAVLINGGVLNMHGGSIADNVNVGYTTGAAVEMQALGAFNLYGGTITGNGSASTRGSAVDVNGSAAGDAPVFQMYGGTITGNVGSAGAGVRVLGSGTFHMHGGSIADNVCGGAEVLISGGGAVMTMDGGVIGAGGSANTVTFRGADGDALTGEFTGGDVYLRIGTDGQADFAVALRGGRFAGIGDGHGGVTVAGGSFADSEYLLDCAAGDRLTVADSGDADFPYALAEDPGVPGDLTGDGKVNGKDAVLLQRFIAGGYGAVLDEAAADLTGDGKVNGKDVVLLSRFLAGGYGVTL